MPAGAPLPAGQEGARQRQQQLRQEAQVGPAPLPLLLQPPKDGLRAAADQQPSAM